MPDMLERALDRVSDVLLFFGCAVTFLMVVHVTVDVAGKYLLGMPIIGTLEVVTYVYMVGCIFLPLAVVQRQRGQVMVEVFTHSLSPRSLAALDGVVGAVCVLFIGALAWHCGRYAWIQTLFQETTKVAEYDMPIWYARWFPAVGLACCAFYLALQSLADLRFAVFGTGRHADVHDGANPREAL
jgi:TRAP-type C4-dicarboxylate transport system permease small subunit